MRSDDSLRLRGVIAAIVVTGVGVAARWSLDPVLESRLPFVTFFIAVAFVVWHSGLRPALLAMLLGFASALMLFIPPRGSLEISSIPVVVDLVIYFAVTSAIIGFGHAARKAQREAESAHRVAHHQRELLRQTLVGIGDAVITTDAEGRVQLLNTVAEELTGWTNKEALGQPLDDVFRILHEASRSPVENPVAKVIESGEVVGLANHTVLIARDGTERPISDSAAPIRDEREKIAGVVLVFRDVTGSRAAEARLEQSEERFRALILATASIVWTTNESGEFVVDQPSWVSHTGQSRDDYMGWGWIEAIHPDDRPRIRALWNRALVARTQYRADHRLWHAASRSYRHIETTAVPLFGADGRIREWVGLCLDVENERRLEEQLKRYVETLSVADRRKNEFLAMLAHELRNPLAPLRNMLEIVKRPDSDGGTMKRAHEVMERQLAQMVHLVDDLLDISRISRGKIELRLDHVELNEVVRHTAEAARLQCEEMHQELSVVLPETSVQVHADAHRLTQVVGNLLSNASKYSPRGSRILLTVARDEHDAILSVQDQGIGIDANELPHIFDLFVQVDTSLERSKSGLGIGLTLAKRIVELHGGSVTARSEGAGQGSEFIVRLPLLLAPPDVARGSDADDGGRVDDPPLPSRRTLVVDDNRDSADSLALLLQLDGHDTYTAYDGHEALKIAESLRPEIVVLDIGLPKLSGYEVAARIRKEPWGSSVVLVAVTGWGQESDRRKSADVGFDGHLVKPVSPDALRELLESASRARTADD